MNLRNRSGRERLLSTLKKDLIGPQGTEDEQVNAWPADQYISGILYPELPDASPEDDDARDAVQESDGGPGEAIPAASVRRPTLMGISFALEGDRPEVRVLLRAGRYILAKDQDEADGIDEAIPTPRPQPEQGAEKEALLDPAQTRAQIWKREPFLGEFQLPVQEGTHSHPAFPGMTWYVRGLRTRFGWQVTVALANTARSGPRRVDINERSWFQVEYRVNAGDGCRLIPRRSQRARTDEDGATHSVIYRSAAEWAVGHTCSAEWGTDASGRFVGATWLPTQMVASVSAAGHEVFRQTSLARTGSEADWVDANRLSRASREELATLLQVLPEAYELWLKETWEKAEREHSKGGLDASQMSRLRAHVALASTVADRIRRGIRVLTDPDEVTARLAFQLAQEAMVLQRRWSEGDLDASLRWRPFQLAFQMLTLESLVNPGPAGGPSEDRLTMDLLWFPTGGGKTEAYLAITAFVIVLRRLREKRPDDGAGVAVMMRYTLRLLTVQQFERACRLILACEHLRREAAKAGDPRLGSVPFSIGLWVGMGATPNSVEAARADGESARKARQLARCPACGLARLIWDANPDSPHYSVNCDNPRCVTSGSGDSLPIYTIDSEVYRVRPSLVIGTIDKFAQIVRNQDTHALFGGQGLPPELIIQDELHLISGPLGTVAGLYEAAVDLICTRDGIPPKVIGSTATIRRAEEQVLHLFNRGVVQFPPPVLDADDSCFAVLDTEAPGRLYCGISTAGRSPKFILQAVCASLMQAASEPLLSDEERDPYWTLVAYFNSLRELGGAVVMMQDDVSDSMHNFANQHGTSRREIAEPMELTSRVNQADIPAFLVRLEEPFVPGLPQAEQSQQIASVLATNMISVGVDVPRLGLMVVNGQPKSMAEYIQATSRVGRNRVPGLVVTVYNAARPRDRSHFEAFCTWHQTLYREVEATSVTPFAPRARDRALHAAVVALARHLVEGMLEFPTLGPAQRSALEQLIDKIALRVSNIDPTEELEMRREAKEFLDDWEGRADLRAYWNDNRPATSLLVSAEKVATARATRGNWDGPALAAPNSMRDVEPEVHFRMVNRLTDRVS